MLNQNEYFEKVAVSNSSLAALNPEQGGSPLKFKQFFIKDTERKQSLSLERGSLVHLYCEDPAAFEIADAIKPSDSISDIIEYLHDKIKETGKRPSYKKVCELILERAKRIHYGQSWTPQTIIKKINDGGADYLRYLFKADTKLIMSSATRNVVESCITSLRGHQRARALVLHDTTGFEDSDTVDFNELSVFWNEPVTIPGTETSIDVPCKARIDVLKVDFIHKIVHIPDIKTTSKSAYSFGESFEYYHYYRQHAFYRTAVFRFLTDKYPGIDFSEFQFVSYNVVVETCGNFQTVVWDVSKEWLDLGHQEVNVLLARYAWHTHTDVWDRTYEEYYNGHCMTLPPRKT